MRSTFKNGRIHTLYADWNLMDAPKHGFQYILKYHWSNENGEDVVLITDENNLRDYLTYCCYSHWDSDCVLNISFHRAHGTINFKEYIEWFVATKELLAKCAAEDKNPENPFEVNVLIRRLEMLMIEELMLMALRL